MHNRHGTIHSFDLRPAATNRNQAVYLGQRSKRLPRTASSTHAWNRSSAMRLRPIRKPCKRQETP